MLGDQHEHRPLRQRQRRPRVHESERTGHRRPAQPPEHQPACRGWSHRPLVADLVLVSSLIVTSYLRRPVMSAETLTAVPGRRAATPRHPGRPVRPVAGMLADGTVFYAPIGEVVIDDELVICHLCGRSLRSVTAHLRVHGWTPGAYREAFGLERGQSLEGPATRKLRAAAFTSRLVFEPAVREGSAAGRQRARDGRLARDAAAAARGRSFPEQRRRKALRSLAAIPPEVIAQANSERACRHLARVAAQVAQSQGYPDIGALGRDQIARGASLAGISRRAGPAPKANQPQARVSPRSGSR
ncbi:MAG: MucR family transcriptional regulator [Streptosporangiaceae bacterium]